MSGVPSPSKSPTTMFWMLVGQVAGTPLAQGAALITSQSDTPPQETSNWPLVFIPTTSVRPSPSKSPSSSVSILSVFALRNRQSRAPPGEKYQAAPVVRNRSSKPSLSKSPTPKEAGPRRVVGSSADEPNTWSKILMGGVGPPKQIDKGEQLLNSTALPWPWSEMFL